MAAQNESSPYVSDAEAADTLATMKTKAEDRVRMLRGRFSDGEITQKELLEAERRYSDARSDVNGGLERILVEMTSPDHRVNEATYTEVARRAGSGADNFVRYADGLLFGENRGVAEAGLSVAGDVVKALVDIWKQLRGERSAQNEALAKRLEALRWDSFGDIK